MTTNERLILTNKIVSQALDEAQNLTNGVFIDHLLLEITKSRMQNLFDMYCKVKLENMNFVKGVGFVEDDLCDLIKLIEKISKETAIGAAQIFKNEENKNG